MATINDKSQAKSDLAADPGAKGIIADFLSGKSLNADELGGADGSDGVTDDDDPAVVHSGRSEEAGDEPAPEGDDAAGDAKDEAAVAEPDATKANEQGKAELFWVTDGQGRRQVPVDWSDKRTRQRLVGAAHGFQGMRQERDNTKKEFTEFRAKADPTLAKWNALEKAWTDSGVEGVVNALSKGTGGKQWSDFVKEARDQQDRLANMSPAELEAWTAREAQKRAEKEVAAIRAERESSAAASKAEREAADDRVFEATLETAFRPFSLVGKLGDEATEHRLSGMLWAGFKQEMASLPDDTIVTDTLMKGILTDLSKAIRGTIDRGVAAGVTGKVAAAKKNAAKGAASHMREQTARAGAVQKAEQAFDEGGTKGIMSFLAKAARAGRG